MQYSYTFIFCKDRDFILKYSLSLWSVINQFSTMSRTHFSSVLLKIILSKYTLVVAVFLVYLIFFDGHNLIRKYRMSREVNQLQQELEVFREEIKKNKDEINKLKTDSLYLEKVAREKYLMKKDDEDIFLFN